MTSRVVLVRAGFGPPGGKPISVKKNVCVAESYRQRTSPSANGSWNKVARVMSGISGVPFTVARETCSHGVPYSSLRYGHLFHLTMAGFALDFRTDMGGMLELHLGIRLELVHALPGHFAPLFGIERVSSDPRRSWRISHNTACICEPTAAPRRPPYPPAR